MSTNGKAGVSLRFVVVGAGIAGLAAAYRLRLAGHEVCVLEKRSGPAWGPHAVTCPPNMTRILDYWGLRPELEAIALKRTGIMFKHCETGRPIADYEYYDWIMRDLAADYLFMKHRDLYNILYELAMSVGVEIRFGATVVHVDPRTPTVSLSSGELVGADIIVGADGLDSLVRRCMEGASQEESSAPLFIAGAVLDKETMTDDAELRALLSSPMATLWLGQRKAMWGCPLPNGGGYSLKVALPPDGYNFVEEYDNECGADQLHIDFSSYESRLQKLIKRIKIFYPAIWKVRRPLDSLVHESKKVVLLGEAAHPIPPNMTHNTALAIEDAAVLSNLFSRIQTRGEVDQLVSAYHEIRYPRALDILHSEVANMCLVSGLEHPYQDRLTELQDRGRRMSTVEGIPDEAPSPEFIRRWDEMIRMFNHDANDSVDEWWHTWGSLMNRATEGGMAGAGEGLLPGRRTPVVRKASMILVQTDQTRD